MRKLVSRLRAVAMVFAVSCFVLAVCFLILPFLLPTFEVGPFPFLYSVTVALLFLLAWVILDGIEKIKRRENGVNNV